MPYTSISDNLRILPGVHNLQRPNWVLETDTPCILVQLHNASRWTLSLHPDLTNLKGKGNNSSNSVNHSHINSSLIEASLSLSSSSIKPYKPSNQARTIIAAIAAEPPYISLKVEHVEAGLVSGEAVVSVEPETDDGEQVSGHTSVWFLSHAVRFKYGNSSLS